MRTMMMMMMRRTMTMTMTKMMAMAMAMTMTMTTTTFQLFIVGSKQFFRSFDPFLLYLTFSILRIEILLDNLIRQGKEFESKRRRKQELELTNTRPGREEAKHLLNARNPLKKNGNTG